MASVMSAIKNTVPISQFNRGLAGKIFEDVKQSGANEKQRCRMCSHFP